MTSIIGFNCYFLELWPRDWGCLEFELRLCSIELEFCALVTLLGLFEDLVAAFEDFYCFVVVEQPVEWFVAAVAVLAISLTKRLWVDICSLLLSICC